MSSGDKEQKLIRTEGADASPSETAPNGKLERPKDDPGIWQKYDRSFMIAYTLQYVNGGTKNLLGLSMIDLTKNEYNVGMAETTFAMSIIWMPWTLKFVLGIFSDNITLCGSRRRLYLFFMGIIQFVCQLMIAFFKFESFFFVAVLLFL